MTATPKIDTVELLRSLEAGLRGGYSLRQAIARTANDLPSEDLASVAASASGAPVEGLFDEWGRDDPDIALVAGAIHLQMETLGNLADTFGLLSRVLERRP